MSETVKFRTDQEIAQWLIDTCLRFGSQTSTAYLVAGTFIKGLEGERMKRSRI